MTSLSSSGEVQRLWAWYHGRDDLDCRQFFKVAAHNRSAEVKFRPLFPSLLVSRITRNYRCIFIKCDEYANYRREKGRIDCGSCPG